MREPFLDRVGKRSLVCDGAMGTMLYGKGVPFSRCFDELNLTQPHLVKEVHLAYVKAGADVIETNSFGATRPRLAKYDLAAKVLDINLAAARLAREVAGDEIYVAGSVGPLGVPLEPLGSTSLDEAKSLYKEQIAALVEGGVDLIIVETMVDPTEARQALLAARDVDPGVPVIVQMTIQEDGATPRGTKAEEFARQLDAWGADLIGLNCSIGPAGVLETLEKIAGVTQRGLSAQPNAGLPRTVDGRSIYLCSPEYMARYAEKFIHAGARLVGGCCGTIPEHIHAIKQAVRSLHVPPAQATIRDQSAPLRALEPLAVGRRSRLAAKLAARQFPILVEMIPPKGCDPTGEVEGAQYLRAQGIDAANISDGPGFAARLSASTLAAIVQQRVGLESLLHYSCLNRNLLGIQSDLLGAYALGIRNILAVSGEPPALAHYPQVTAVRDVDSIGLVNLLSNLNRGLDIGGNPIGSQTGFLIGVEANPYALDPEEEQRRFHYKVEAGANFALTQPVFDGRNLQRFLARIGSGGVPPIPVIASIHPLTSFRHAEFLNNEVPGVSVPPPILERMRGAGAGDKARAEGLKIAQELLLEIREMVQGVQIAAPFGRYAMAVEVAHVLAESEVRAPNSPA